MSNTDRKQSVDSESAVLVGVQLSEDTFHGDPLDELSGLVKTAGAEVVGRMTQKRHAPDAATYIGHGKVEELQFLVEATEADVVIFDNDLSPAQMRNLEEQLKVKVLDRTEVILDIFSSRAQTYESRLAVELAQLEYSLPRLKGMWKHLSRMKMGVGMRGPGEKQLETDRRLAEKRITDLRRELEKVQRRKEREVAGRSDRMTVSLVGYTNAGKSTLMNALTDSHVLAEDKLFATLDTRTRRWHLPGWGPVLLSDTVGFIRNLPHNLIASFKATLEEARQADLLIHVADASSPVALDQIKAVYDVLRELGIEEKDTLLALNKVDQVEDPTRLQAIRQLYPSAVLISARTEDGLPRLASAVSDALSQDFLDLEFRFSVSNGRLLAYLAKYGEVISRTFAGDRASVHCRLSRKHLGSLRDDPEIEVHPYIASPLGRHTAAGDEAVGEVA
ncbi:GTPase HflX [Lacipirellula parvula]|uniref:GTPase HflX n=1 Tax=Lacipirellula parvula TaxID=2650471 RepID=A0A5K7X7S2_9BACT|nr:ribosome LSU-associated GTP-binding protein HflX [Lacipirellula parvula]